MTRGRGSIREIRIRKLSYSEAQLKLETELNQAFVAGEQRVFVIHGIGSGQLKRMTARVVQELGLGRIVEQELNPNPGQTVVDLLPPDKQTLRRYMQ